MHHRIEKAKKHIQQNKMVYIGTTAGIIVGGVSIFIIAGEGI